MGIMIAGAAVLVFALVLPAGREDVARFPGSLIVAIVGKGSLKTPKKAIKYKNVW
jgi:hypothetical protein